MRYEWSEAAKPSANVRHNGQRLTAAVPNAIYKLWEMCTCSKIGIIMHYSADPAGMGGWMFCSALDVKEAS